VETVESQRQAFHRSHERLEIAKGSDFHIPTTPGCGYRVPTSTQPKDLYGDRGKGEIQRRDFHSSTVPICLRRKEKIPTGREDRQQE
jgi:hypothetical protein